MAKVATRVAQRISTTLKRFQPIIASAKARDVNEADTATIVTDLLSEVLGYDKYSEVTAEHSIRGTYCDLAIRLDNRVALLIECKAVGIFLKDQHAKQAIDYAANQGVDWVVLTNGHIWRVYRVNFGKPVTAEQVIEFDILELDARKTIDIEKLALLAKEGWRKARLGDYHARLQVLSRFTLAALIVSDPVLSVLKRELRHISPDVRISEEQIAEVLRGEVVKRETLEGDEANVARKLVIKTASRSHRDLRPKGSTETHDGAELKSSAPVAVKANDGALS